MPYKPPRKTRHVRIDRLSPPVLTENEIDLYQIAMADGIVQAIEAYPAFFTEADPLWALARSRCQETDNRLRSVWLEAFVGGYVGFTCSAKVEPRKVLARITEARTRTREENLLVYLLKSATYLAQ